MDNDAKRQETLDDLRSQQRLRELTPYPGAGAHVTVDGKSYLNLSANDYLGLAGHPKVVAASRAALEQYGTGATASRLVTGTFDLHEQLEQRLAAFKGYPACLLFGSGYLCNAGVISSVVGKDDHVFADRLAHASILDAVRLSGARLHRFHHNDPSHLEQLLSKHGTGGVALVVTEALFSMDGDLAPLRELSEVAERHGALLMADEGHSTGVFGPEGRGCVSAESLQSSVALSMGTLSKALGGYGGFVACSETMRAFMVNRARAFIYTTAPPPAVVGAALGALDVLEEMPDAGSRLLEKATRFRGRLNEAGFDTMQSASQIVPLLVGTDEKALALSSALKQRGVLSIAIRPPTVPPGQSRLRFSISLAHTDEELGEAAVAVIECAAALL